MYRLNRINRSINQRPFSSVDHQLPGAKGWKRKLTESPLPLISIFQISLQNIALYGQGRCYILLTGFPSKPNATAYPNVLIHQIKRERDAEHGNEKLESLATQRVDHDFSLVG